MKQGLIGAVVAVAVIVLAGFGIAFSGILNVAADEPAGGFEAWFLHSAMDRSVGSRTSEIVVPPLDDPEMLAGGAKAYDSMCASCHGGPGLTPGWIVKGLHPRPPDFGTDFPTDAARAFWVTKHGIKMTGMPASGPTHADKDMWNMVAFLMQFPKMSKAEYTALVVAPSKGHHHGASGEAGDHHGDETVDAKPDEAAHDHGGDKADAGHDDQPHAH